MLKLEGVFADEFELDQQLVKVSASIGIAMFPDHGDTPAELLRRADVAMYHAKRSGGGHTVADNAQEEVATRQLELLLELRECVSRSELILHYQPKIQLGTGLICGVEALDRWQHPDRGLLLPGVFMADVERTELLGQLTQWVLNEALRQQRVWGDSGIDLTMAVNISAARLTARSTLLEILEAGAGDLGYQARSPDPGAHRKRPDRVRGPPPSRTDTRPGNQAVDR